MSPLDVVVTVPIAGIGLDEANPLLDQTAGQKTFSSKRIRLAVSNPIRLSGLLGLSFNIEKGRYLHLHPVSQFVG